MPPKSKVNPNVLNCSDKVKNLDLLKISMSLVDVGQHSGEINQASAVQH
jgi:hypothetical protein